MNSVARSLSFLSLAGLAVLVLPSTARCDDLDAKQRELVVQSITEKLEQKYVFPDVAKRCGEHLRAELDAGKFDGLDQPQAFARALTKALQSISKDKHVRVGVRRPERARIEQENPEIARLQQLDRMRQKNFGFESVEHLDGNIGYVDMRGFIPVQHARDTAAGAMAFLANSDAIIFDMRKNGGGSPDLIQFICSYFFDEPTHLNSLYWREGDTTEEFWTLPEVPGKRMPDVPLFVLTSDYTFSGAEEFAYNLRTRERATLVGETTGGGANPGGSVPIDGGFRIFIPTGRAINPVTGTNWEGVGVEHHIAVPAEDALERALVEARKAADTYRESTLARRVSMWTDVTDRLRSAEKLFEAGSAEAGAQAVEAALKLGREGALLEEDSINMLGYERLQQGSVDASIAIFRFNSGAYPESFNVWDSLGEAYMEKGQLDLAIRNYEKSLELNPGNANAVEMIERMKNK